MYQQILSLAVVLSATSAAYAQLPDKPRTPTPTPEFREAFIPNGSDVLLSDPMDAELDGEPIWLWRYHKRKLADLVITNALGETLTDEQILNALDEPKIVLVSSDGEPVHPYYLQVIRPETLVIIDKTPNRDD